MGIATPPNESLSGRRNRGNSSELPKTPQSGRGAQPPDHRLDVSKAKMPQPPSAIEPGRGDIPVRPFGGNGMPSHVEVSIPDMGWIRRTK